MHRVKNKFQSPPRVPPVAHLLTDKADLGRYRRRGGPIYRAAIRKFVTCLGRSLPSNSERIPTRRINHGWSSKKGNPLLPTTEYCSSFYYKGIHKQKPYGTQSCHGCRILRRNRLRTESGSGSLGTDKGANERRTHRRLDGHDTRLNGNGLASC